MSATGMKMASELAMAAAGTTIFAYCVLLKLPRGKPRLLATMPWIPLLAFLAWNVPTVHLRTLISFFFLWMIPFKLMLLCWDRGPAADPKTKSSFFRFFAAMTMSIHVSSYGTLKSSSQSEPWSLVLARALLKLCLVALLFVLYAIRDQLPDPVLFLVFSIHVYLVISLMFEVLAALTGVLLGLKLEPHFDNPLLATSLSDFWGRRWNRLVSSVLRASVYEPLLNLSLTTNAKVRVEPKVGRFDSEFRSTSVSKVTNTKPPLWSRALAALLVFLVSGLMHEVIFCYMNQSGPTWEVTVFFLVNGVATVCEVFVKKQFGNFLCLPRPVSVLFTLSFVFVTACWLFFPPIHRTGTCLQALDEFEAVLTWLCSKLGLGYMLSSSSGAENSTVEGVSFIP